MSTLPLHRLALVLAVFITLLEPLCCSYTKHHGLDSDKNHNNTGHTSSHPANSTQPTHRIRVSPAGDPSTLPLAQHTPSALPVTVQLLLLILLAVGIGVMFYYIRRQMIAHYTAKHIVLPRHRMPFTRPNRMILLKMS